MGRKTDADPTGQATNRKRATRAIDARLRQAKRRVLDRFAQVPRTRITVNESRYAYDLSAEQQQALQGEIRAYLDDELGTDGNTVDADWFWRKEVEPPYRQGVTEEVVVYNHDVVALALAMGVTVQGMKPQPVAAETVLYSRAYREALNTVYVRNYNSIKTLSSRTADQVIQRINAGISAGMTPTEIAEQITERFGVARSDAKRIADTEINQAYTDAKMDATNMAAAQTGLRSGVRHISALTPTTRDSHAARHGHVYTVTEQEKWWNTGANRINCKCSVRSVLLDASGNEVTEE